MRIGLSLAAVLGIGLTILILQRAATDNGIVYALDDVYIHMALAKNLAAHGVWGVTPWETTNASSSPLWVIALTAGFLVGGINGWTPLLLAGAAALSVLLAGAHCLSQATPPAADRPGRLTIRAVTIVALLAIVLVASLPALTLQGMEHPLHAAAMLLGASAMARAIATSYTPALPGYALLCAALPLLRYESLWLIVLGASLLALRRRYALAALTLACGVLPVVGFGLWALAHDQSFLPAAILTKSIGPASLADDGLRRLVARFSWHPLQRVWSVPVLFVLWLAACAILALRLAQLRRAILEQRWLVLLGLFAAGAWIHATFATFGWGSRYEAYLIVLGIVALAGWSLQDAERNAVAAILPWRRAGTILAVGFILLFLWTGANRLIVVTRNAIIATEEVRDRDLFIAHFLADAYPRQSVMAMNIGALVWTGEPRLTDVLALGDTQTLRLFLRGQLDPAQLDRLAAERQVKVAVIFDQWFGEWTGGKAPWIAVAAVDPHARRRLDFTLYARTEADARILAERLKAYRPAPHFRATVRLLPPYQ